MPPDPDVFILPIEVFSTGVTDKNTVLHGNTAFACVCIVSIKDEGSTHMQWLQFCLSIRLSDFSFRDSYHYGCGFNHL